MSKQIHDDTQTGKVTVRAPQSLIEKYDQTIGSEKSRSQAIREHMRRTVGEVPDQIVPPKEDVLRKGWQAIQEAAGPRDYIKISTAKDRISENTRVRKDDVIQNVVKPLHDRGYIQAPYTDQGLLGGTDAHRIKVLL